jgi:hypothetical protein
MLVRSGSHVAIADRERHAYNVGVATCFWCIFFWNALKQCSCAVLKIPPLRVGFQDLKDCKSRQAGCTRSRRGSGLALLSMPHEMKQLHRDAPCGRLRDCCGGRVLSRLPRRVFARMLWSVWLRRVEVALSMKLISTCYSQRPGWRKRSSSWRGGPQYLQRHGTRAMCP